MSAELRIEHLRKVFATGVAAVDDVNFRIEAGEIVVLLGPSGCGKTTTLRCVAGLEHPTSGTIAIGGTLVSAPEQGILMPPRLRNIGMVFQSYAVWPHMTVAQNVGYPLRHRRTPRAERKSKIEGVLEVVGLSAYADRPVVQLSGGQMQRVALARSLVYEPQLLLLDEPLSNLDAKLRLRLRDDLRRIIKRAGVTALYVTHDQAEAVVLGDRIGVMREGKLLQMAPATTLYNRPADLFVANFTGASNLLDGRVLERAEEFGTVEAGSGQKLAAWLPASVKAGEPVKIAVRPENVRLGVNGAAAPNTFTARVTDTRYQGTQTVYELDVLGGRIDALELGTQVRYPIGSDVKVVLPPDLCWAYPARETTDSE
jgi:iron(III) transport system ATP-binding protein